MAGFCIQEMVKMCSNCVFVVLAVSVLIFCFYQFLLGHCVGMVLVCTDRITTVVERCPTFFSRFDLINLIQWNAKFIQVKLKQRFSTHFSIFFFWGLLLLLLICIHTLFHLDMHQKCELIVIVGQFSLVNCFDGAFHCAHLCLHLFMCPIICGCCMLLTFRWSHLDRDVNHA